LARQPIFDRRQKVIAYELLYRASEENFNPELNGDRATSEVVASTFINIGLDKIARGNRAFINFTRQLINDQTVFLLPKEQVAIEITEDIEPDQQMLETCQHLHREGYVLVLDDFNLTSKCKDLLDCVDIVKVDLQATVDTERKKIISFLRKGRQKILAEKVETIQEYKDALTVGYDYFQGYFFCKPVIISGKEISSTKLQNLRLLGEIYNPAMDVGYIEKIIKQDTTLSYKLLRFINSATFALRFPISSIRQAITLLGQKEMIKWASLVALRNIGYDKPDELIVTSTLRASFCEALAVATNLRELSGELFLTGLFSLLDTFLDQPMEEVLAELPLSAQTKQALLGEESEYKIILDFVLLYEKGAFAEAHALLPEELYVNETVVMNFYLESLELANSAWK